MKWKRNSKFLTIMFMPAAVFFATAVAAERAPRDISDATFYFSLTLIAFWFLKMLTYQRQMNKLLNLLFDPNTDRSLLKEINKSAIPGMLIKSITFSFEDFILDPFKWNIVTPVNRPYIDFAKAMNRMKGGR